MSIRSIALCRGRSRRYRAAMTMRAGGERRERWTTTALAGVMLAALLLRLQGIAFGLPALYDPDEGIFLLQSLKLLRDATLNPGWFGHPGTTTIYALALVEVGVLGAGLLTGRFADAEAFGQAIYADPGVAILPGRHLMLAIGLAAVALTFLLARRLGGARVALLAAALVAVDPLHVRYSQIIRTDMMASMFVLASLYFAVAIVRRGHGRDYLLAGVMLGLAIASKWPAGTAFVAVAGAATGRTLAHPAERYRHARLLTLAALATIGGALVASPYLLLDYRTVIANVAGEAQPHHLGASGDGFAHNLLWYIGGPLRQSAGGWFGLALALVGGGAAARRSAMFRWTVAPFAIVFLAAISTQSIVWARWAVPLLSLVAIAEAFAIAVLAGWIARALPRTGARAAAAALVLAALLPPLIAARAEAVERTHDTRGLARDWAIANIPPGSTVIVEHFAFDLLGHGWRFLYPVGDAGCVDVAASLKAKIRHSTIDRWRGGRAIVDVGTLPPSRVPTCRADYAIFVDYDRYLAERGRYGREIANYRAVMGDGRVVAVFRPAPGRVGGPVVRIARLGRQAP